jgi:hypothetical protein
MSLVYHYTSWSELVAIVESGYLLPSNAGAPDETPLLWFSANQRWEPTATKTVRADSGLIQRLTFRQQLRTIGCIRFSISADDSRLRCWKDACAFVGIRRDDRRSLERVGKKLGAVPSHWFAMPDRAPMNELLLELFLDDVWRPGNPREMARVWQDHRLESTAV